MPENRACQLDRQAVRLSQSDHAIEKFVIFPDQMNFWCNADDEAPSGPLKCVEVRKALCKALRDRRSLARRNTHKFF